MYVFGTLGPIVLIIALGVFLRRIGFAEEAFFRQTNRLVYWVALPCLLFAKTAVMTPDLETAFEAFAVMLCGTAVALLASFPVGAALGLRPASQAAFAQVSFRGNLAYVGLPVVLFALAGAEQGVTAQDEAIAVLAMAPLIPLYNIAAIWVLLRGGDRQRGESRGLGHVFVQMGSNPILIGVVAGLLYALTGLPLPRLVERTLSALGQLALPLALLGIGASLSFAALRGHVRATLAGTAIKIGLCPLAGLVAARLLGVSGTQLLVALLFLACPTATASYVMAERLDGDAPLTAAVIVLSTVLTIPVLALILATAL